MSRQTRLVDFMLANRGEMPIELIYNWVFTADTDIKYNEENHRRCQQLLGTVISRANASFDKSILRFNWRIQPGKQKRTYELIATPLEQRNAKTLSGA